MTVITRMILVADEGKVLTDGTGYYHSVNTPEDKASRWTEVDDPAQGQTDEDGDAQNEQEN